MNPQHADQNLQDPTDNLDNPNQTEELLAKIKDLHKRVPPIPPHFSTDEFLRKAKEAESSIRLLQTRILLPYLTIPGDRTPLAKQILQKDATWVAPRMWQSEFQNVIADIS